MEGKRLNICARCGKVLGRWHIVRNRKVCADDRLCYPLEGKEYGSTSRHGDKGYRGQQI